VANIERWERIGRWFMAAWVLFTLPTVVSVVRSGFEPPQLAVAFAFLAWGGTWAWLWLRAMGRDPAGEVVALVSITVLSALFSIIEPNPEGTVLVFACIIASCIFPPLRAGAALLGIAILQVAVLFARQADFTSSATVLINDVLVGLVAAGARFFWLAYLELIAAREQLAQLAVAEERLRFARDLHDLLGQSLSVLVLKSELVSRQLPEDADEPLRQEVRDIAQVARTSLDDVREAVAGYRQADLQSEISSARTALRSAGIGLLVEDTLGRPPAEVDGVLAWCLREAVTNVVRHSGARRCEVRLSRANGSARLEVMDDGRGAISLDGGSGLAGMRERVEIAGGSLQVGSENGGGLHLLVSLPGLA
jgi:two-component system, NarL family, sensor histidine kinase DesK